MRTQDGGFFYFGGVSDEKRYHNILFMQQRIGNFKAGKGYKGVSHNSCIV